MVVGRDSETYCLADFSSIWSDADGWGLESHARVDHQGTRRTSDQPTVMKMTLRQAEALIAGFTGLYELR